MTYFGRIRPSSGALDVELQHMVFCTEFVGGLWSWQPLPLSRWWVEVQLYSSMTSALKGVSGQQHAPAALYHRERPGTHFTGGWVGPRAGLDGRKISSPSGFDPGPSNPWLSRYTDWTTRPTLRTSEIIKFGKTSYSDALHWRKIGNKQAAGTSPALIHPHLGELSEQFLPYGSLLIRPIWPKWVDLFHYLQWAGCLAKIADIFRVSVWILEGLVTALLHFQQHTYAITRFCYFIIKTSTQNVPAARLNTRCSLPPIIDKLMSSKEAQVSHSYRRNMKTFSCCPVVRRVRKNCEKQLLPSCLSVRLHGTRLQMEVFSYNFIFEYFSKIYCENSSLINIWQEYRVHYTKTNKQCDHISLIF